MKKIVLASQNPNKVKEIQSQLGDDLKVLSLIDIGHEEELEEDQETLEGNALQKARFVYRELGYDCFADDTGLEVYALEKRPGVRSARYAGSEKSATANMDKLLDELHGVQDRSARFRTVIALVINGKEYLFEGICEGVILEEKRGEGGFGYDPIFQPRGYSQSFAEMSLKEKAKIGHRGKAVDKFVRFFRNFSPTKD